MADENAPLEAIENVAGESIAVGETHEEPKRKKRVRASSDAPQRKRSKSANKVGSTASPASDSAERPSAPVAQALALKKKNGKAAVFRGVKDKTQGGLTRDDIAKKQIGSDEKGRPVYRYISKKKSEIGQERYKESKLKKWNLAVMQIKGVVTPVRKNDPDYASVRRIYEDMLAQERSSFDQPAERNESDADDVKLPDLTIDGVLTQAY